MNWIGPKLNLRVAQKQVLTPGLVQMVSVLALNQLELHDMISQEIMQNPMLEELGDDGVTTENYSDETFVKTESEKVPEAPASNPFDEFDFGSFFSQYLDPGGQNISQEREEAEEPSYEKFMGNRAGLTEHLQWQLGGSICSETAREIAEEIIGNLDDNGYLKATLEEIAATGPYEMDDVDEALAVVQEFDPPGVAARDLRECLLLQLMLLGGHGTLPQQIVSDHLKLLENNQVKEIARSLDRPIELVKKAVEAIRGLDPRPGLRYNRPEPRLVKPDVTFEKEEGQWKVKMNDEDTPQLRISPVYRRLLAKDAADKEVRNYVKERFTAAVQFMRNIEQRRHAILKVCDVILRRQADFLDYGPDHLKPLMIKEVAEEVGVHPSTVSRAVANKYTHTPRGVIELRRFFSESVNGPQGSNMSLQTLKLRVKKMIEEEDTSHPLTDDELARRLQAAGIQVTRRTVAKYREDMNIPSTHQRRVKT
jgi:RNA polymerase sigma-54 factor